MSLEASLTTSSWLETPPSEMSAGKSHNFVFGGHQNMEITRVWIIHSQIQLKKSLKVCWLCTKISVKDQVIPIPHRFTKASLTPQAKVLIWTKFLLIPQEHWTKSATGYFSSLISCELFCKHSNRLCHSQDTLSKVAVGGTLSYFTHITYSVYHWLQHWGCLSCNVCLYLCILIITALQE